jgi:hypothetical protein
LRTAPCFSAVCPQNGVFLRIAGGFPNICPQFGLALRTAQGNLVVRCAKMGVFAHRIQFFRPPCANRALSAHRVGPLVRTSLRSTHRTARDATPVAWCGRNKRAASGRF